MRTLLILFGMMFFYHLNGQSIISINEAFNSEDGLLHELSIESSFTPKINMSIKLGSSFNGVSTYKFGLRYKIFETNTTKFRLGIDLGQSQFQFNSETTKRSRRTMEFLTGITQDISQKVVGVFEIGLSNKEYYTDVTPLVLRIGLGYKF